MTSIFRQKYILEVNFGIIVVRDYITVENISGFIENRNYNNMSGLEYLIGDPIDAFPDNHLPTHGEVLCFYSQYWGVNASDSSKEKLVARELIQVYQERDIPVLNEKTVKDKIKKNVCDLKKILKFKSKLKTAANIESERIFLSKLKEIFDIRGRNPIEGRPNDGPSSSGESSCSSVAAFDGILFISVEIQMWFSS